MDNVNDLIIATLSDHHSALTITEISNITRLNRHTIARQLDTLELLGKVRKIHHGNAKKYFCVASVPVSGLIDISSDLIIIVDKNLIIQYINNAAEQKLGLSSMEIVGERIDMLNADIFSSQQVIEGLKNHSPNKIFRTEVQHPDGTIYSTTILEISLEIGRNLIAITAEDITQARQAERAIIESEEKYKALFKSNADPVFLILQESGNITDVNEAACQMYGYNREEFLGMCFTGISLEPQKTARYILKPISFTPLDYHHHRNGRVFPVELSAAVVQIKGVNTIITTVRDITKRLMVEEAISQIRRNFETFFNTIDDYLFVVNQKGIIIEVNKTVIQRLGYARDELIGSSILKVHPADRHEEAGQIIHDVIAGITTTCPIPLITKKGIRIPVETKITSGEWNGKPALFGVCKDITQITISEEKYRTLFQASPDAVFMVEQDGGRIIDANPSASRIYGYSHEELLQMKNEDVSAEPEKTIRATKDPHPHIPLRYHRHKDGTIFPVDITANILVLQDKPYIIATVRDISERIKREEMEHAREEIFRLIPETINEVFWVADLLLETNFYISPGYEQIWGRTRESLEKNPRSFLDAIYEEDRERIITDMETKKKQGLPFDHEYRITLPDGTIRTIRDRGFPIKDDNGVVVRYAGVAMDITNQK